LSLDGTEVTDAGMEHLKGLTQLQWLDIGGTKITDAGLEHIKSLTQLQNLCLRGTEVTDAGLEHVQGLTQLYGLDLFLTKTTDVGVKKLQQVLPNCTITVRGHYDLNGNLQQIHVSPSVLEQVWENLPDFPWAENGLESRQLLEFTL
jgi:hypothetical protein